MRCAHTRSGEAGPSPKRGTPAQTSGQIQGPPLFGPRNPNLALITWLWVRHWPNASHRATLPAPSPVTCPEGPSLTSRPQETSSSLSIPHLPQFAPLSITQSESYFCVCVLMSNHAAFLIHRCGLVLSLSRPFNRHRMNGRGMHGVHYTPGSIPGEVSPWR